MLVGYIFLGELLFVDLRFRGVRTSRSNSTRDAFPCLSVEVLLYMHLVSASRVSYIVIQSEVLFIDLSIACFS